MRSPLPEGTILRFHGKDDYIIVGSPVGEGGGSILYPVRHCITQGDTYHIGKYNYVLKECFPESSASKFERHNSGEIVPKHDEPEAWAYLQKVKKMQLAEKEITEEIYQTGFRLTPIIDGVQTVELSFDNGKNFHTVKNTVTVMESLVNKGQALQYYLKTIRRIPIFQTFRIIEQVLLAVQEVHYAGYLHLDLQEGNVFIKGSLDNGSEFTSLIDFGSARKQMKDGKCETIADRVIFSTHGFSAPEIVFGNDGTLRLGPEADIFSIGALMLYMLSGHRPKENEIYRQTGSYLSAFTLQRIKCPRHLKTGLQKILSGCLNNNPEERYHSTDEMLKEVSDFINALQPYRSGLASVDYDAFICYKHGVTDNLVAEELQRQIEHFRCPADLRQNHRSNAYQRVFLDKGELSSCADFGQQIRTAIQNSEWLIVVCSPETPQSPWVREEIDCFLETHDRSHILAVLTEGEPEESFPPQLLGKSIQSQVLAADARGADTKAILKNIRKDTLYRITAPMLGTTFDGLKQRHKAYVLRRTAVAACIGLGISMCFTAYTSMQAHIISLQERQLEVEHRSTLLGESRYLANQAEGYLAENDPISAIQASLKALPSDTQKRPVLSDAEYALSKALGTYCTPRWVHNSMTAVGRIAEVIRFPDVYFTDSNGDYLFVIGGNTINVWDTVSLQRKQSVQFDNTIVCASARTLLPGKSILAVQTKDSLSCYDYQEDKVIWSSTIWGELGNGQYTALSPDGGSLYTVGGNKLFKLDSKNGSVQGMYSFGLDENEQVKQVVISRKEEYAALVVWDSDKYEYASHIVYIDLRTNLASEIPVEEKWLYSVQFAEDNLLIQSGEYYLFSYSASQLDSVQVIGDQVEVLTCVNVEKNEVLWKQQYLYTSNSENHIQELQIPQYGEECYFKEQVVAAVFANHMLIIDPKSGTEQDHFEFASSVVGTDLRKEGAIVYTENGSRNIIHYGESSIYENAAFPNKTTKVCFSGQTFFVCTDYGNGIRNDYQIIKYEYEKYDPNFTSHFLLSSEEIDLLDYQVFTEGDFTILISIGRVWILDLKSGTKTSFELPHNTKEYSFLKEYTFCWFDKEKTSFYFYHDARFSEDESWKIVEINLPDKTIQQFTLPLTTEEFSRIEDVVFFEGTVYFTSWIENEFQYKEDSFVERNEIGLFSWGVDNHNIQKIASYELYTQEDVSFNQTGDFLFEYRDGKYYSYIRNSLSVNQMGTQIQFLMHEYSTNEIMNVSVNMQSNRVTVNSEKNKEDNSYFRSLSRSKSGKIVAIILDESVIILDQKMRFLGECSSRGEVLHIMYTPDDSKMLIFSNNFPDNGMWISEYRVSDGLLLAERFFDKISTIRDDLWMGFIDSSTVVFHTHLGGFIFDISPDTFGIKSQIGHSIGYDQSLDRFVTLSRSEETVDLVELGTFPRYSTKDLIGLGKERIALFGDEK